MKDGQRLLHDFAYFAEIQLKIRAKSGKIIPFRLNKAQKYILKRAIEQEKRTGKIRLAVLKGRQQGLSTFIGGYLYHRTISKRGTLTFIFAHDSEGSSSLYDMVRTFYYEGEYQDLKPTLGASNAKELLFTKLLSGYKVGTAGTKGLGRSKTIQNLHWSEVAYSPNCEDHARGVLQAVPEIDGTCVFLESTSNGEGDFFHRICMQALTGNTESGYEMVFIPWYWQEEYAFESTEDLDEEEKELLRLYSNDGLTAGHLHWRRHKIKNDFQGEVLRFKREYPFTPEEAFESDDEESFIKSSMVRSARNARPVQTQAPLIMGVDPSRLGGDRFVVANRIGRNINRIVSYPADTLDKNVTRLIHDINKYKPSKVNVDAGGLGVGLYDMLVSMGYGNIARKVDFGGKPNQSDKYKNRRAEMYGAFRDWLLDEPCSIDLEQRVAEQLQAELTVTKAKWHNNSTLMLEPKEDIKKRLGYSPDFADAVALTFADPIAAYATHSSMPNLNQAITIQNDWQPF